MKTKSIMGLLSCIALALCLYVTPSTNAATAEEEVLQVAINYVKADNTNDFKLMDSLFWHSPKTSAFWPQGNNPFLIQGWEEMEKLNQSEVEMPERSVLVSLHNPQVTMLTDEVAIFTGYHNAIVNPPLVKEQTVFRFRETLVVQKIGGKWLIVHQHGSTFR